MASEADHNPLISIITVVFNGESLIADTLQSAISQTWKNTELVIVDGASKDGTVEAAKRFHQYTGTLISERDEGIYDAMNKGIRAARGEWVYFLNAGDLFYDERVLEDIFAGRDLGETDLIYAKVQTLNEPTGIDYVAGEPVTFKSFFSRYPICHQATFTRRSVFDRIGTYNTRYKLAADTEWFARFFRQQPGRALYIDRIVAYYDIQGTTYHQRMAGYREYLDFGRTMFPLTVSIRNSLSYPLLWMKVRLIRLLQGTSMFRKYRLLKFSHRTAPHSN
jgi:glycosyltransferase involved in cell wall biosynthesis